MCIWQIVILVLDEVDSDNPTPDASPAKDGGRTGPLRGVRFTVPRPASLQAGVWSWTCDP